MWTTWNRLLNGLWNKMYISTKLLWFKLQLYCDIAIVLDVKPGVHYLKQHMQVGLLFISHLVNSPVMLWSKKIGIHLAEGYLTLSTPYIMHEFFTFVVYCCKAIGVEGIYTRMAWFFHSPVWKHSSSMLLLKYLGVCRGNWLKYINQLMQTFGC